MTIQVAIKHKTEYHFDKLIEIFPHTIRLRPAPHSRTSILSYSLKIEPQEHFINWQQDPFGNYLARLVFPKKCRRLLIDVELIAEMIVINPFDFFLETYAEQFPFQYDPQLAKDLAPYLQVMERSKQLENWLADIDCRKPRSTIEFLVDLNQRVQRDIHYVIRMEPGVQSCTETLSLRKGSCRDSAWLLVQILRHLGLAARFVSGYLVQLKADIPSLQGPSGPAHDFTDLHAWAEVYIPGAGWIGLDPTSGLLAAEGHIPLACTPETASAAPVTGEIERCEVTFHFENNVTRLYESPRVTYPYSDTQWEEINALGTHVDTVLQESDARLTMGGEPTFVSMDDMQSAEWNHKALGKNKRELSELLLLRLKERFSNGAFIHIGQGKWYPGEPLPRWALSVYWRKDGKAVWSNPALFAKRDEKTCFNKTDAERLIITLAECLKLNKQNIVPAYEDDWYYLWKEGCLPENSDPHNNQLSDPLERARLREVFDNRLETVVAYVLPIKWQRGCWQSSIWRFKRGRMYLLPGDSPAGLRLPLDRLTWQEPQKYDTDFERDPFSVQQPLAETLPRYQLSEEKIHSHSQQSMDTIRTALCVEAREGMLHVFMPPLPELEAYLMLLSSVELSLETLNVTAVIEGYEPPQDVRLQKLQITPDPGVIEVNVHPASSWPELVDIISTLYAEAHKLRLGTEKFMLDGRHTGTGGGNHVTLGGVTPADSPFLRKPEVLRSVISYWQRHPSLSYLFSGMFIGPTSQAPRVDEARDDNLYELEIAFQQLPDGEIAQPWLVDRVLRNFLVDLTGNTHRAEFCIDKLYSPDNARGRLGLIEFRNFEMPPHARMSMVQMLLLRALIAHFWQNTYKQPLIRWGTELHDRYMLPYFVWKDFKQVIVDLQQQGFCFDPEWFMPFYSFRFPHYGHICINDIRIDLQAAIEPWHVLGEESSQQGTARYVDSSVERMQVRVQNMLDDRYLITCNGRRLPLHSTGVRGDYVAGVRYKAWSPPSALHPTIPVHTPLVFDVVHKQHQRSVGGCVYHVAHPGGRNYETFPVNANEAESRRIARFWKHGYTQGKMSVAYEEPHPDHPYTLDLRYSIK